MSIASQITRIQQDRNTIRNKLIELGLATGTDNLDVLAEAIDGITDQGDVTVNVKEGETYTIPAGYHSGKGTVSGIAGGGNYSLQSKSVTPTKKTQNITPDDGYYGIADVSVAPIPDAYQDVTSVTAGAADVLTGKTIVSSTGVVTAGTMTNNGAVDKTLTTADASYTVPGGYHSGAGTVKIVPEDKTVTPTKSAQDVTASSGKVLNKVTVAAIPDEYQVVTEVDAEDYHVLTGKKIVSATGEVVTGTMPNRGSEEVLIDAGKGLPNLDTGIVYTIPAGYHDGTGTVTVPVDTIELTPSKQTETVPADSALFCQVTVNPIPDEYQDVTPVTAAAGDVLTGKKIVDATGTVVNGSMVNNGAVTKTLDATTGNQSYTVPTGYHNGQGSVTITLEEKSATPTKSAQTVTPTDGKVLSKVTVAAIPDAYQDVTQVDAEAAQVLDGKKIVSSTGEVVTGSMPNNADVSATLDGLTTLSVTIPAGYTTGGTVSLTSDIEQALAAI